MIQNKERKEGMQRSLKGHNEREVQIWKATAERGGQKTRTVNQRGGHKTRTVNQGVDRKQGL